MRGRLDRPVTEEERRQVRDPFASWGGYVAPTGDPLHAATTPRPTSTTTTCRTTSCRRELIIGIPFLGNLQDRAMTETMGPIYDRTQEHLGTTDAMVILVRRRLIEAARALRSQGELPANVDDPNLCRVRPASAVLPDGESWIGATEKARQSDAGVPIAWVPFVHHTKGTHAIGTPASDWRAFSVALIQLAPSGRTAEAGRTRQRFGSSTLGGSAPWLRSARAASMSRRLTEDHHGVGGAQVLLRPVVDRPHRLGHGAVLQVAEERDAEGQLLLQLVVLPVVVVDVGRGVVARGADRRPTRRSRPRRRRDRAPGAPPPR